MAPKDVNDPGFSASHEDDVMSAGSSKRHVESWDERFRNKVQELIRSIQNSKVSRQRLLMGLAVTVLTLVGYKYRRRLTKRLLPALAAIWIRPDYQSATEAPLSMLYRAVQDDCIERALLGTTAVYFLSKGKWKRSTLPPNNPHLQTDLLETLSTKAHVAPLPESLSSQLATPVLAALPFVYLALLYRMMRNLTGGEDISSKIHSASTLTTFRDVAGIDQAVLEVAEVVTFLRDPFRYTAVGARPPKGVLVYGPPGSGKTLLARAVAGEAAVDSFTACSASDFVEMYVGRGAARVRSLFAQARYEARSKHNHWWNRLLGTNNMTKATAICFIDELDALAKSRSSWNSNDEREQTLNQLLTEMDGFAEHEDVTLVVIAATNRADILDPAILRRFDRQISVGYPDAAGRKAILQIHARHIQSETTIDWDSLAADIMTAGFSGADLRNVVNEAAMLAVREGSHTVHQSHLEHAVRRIRQMKDSVSSSAGPNLVELS